MPRLSLRHPVAALLIAATSPALLVAQHHHDARTDSIVAVAKAAMGTLRHPDSLRKNQWNALGFGGGVKDLTPFQGQHWINFPRFNTPPVPAGQPFPPIDVSQPQFLMYLAVSDSLIPIGVAYTKRIGAGASLPDSLAGAPAEWHSHIFCLRIPGEGNVLADGPEDCAQRGGSAAPNQIAMIHTWTVPNPDGPYSHDNPALPYIATGLKAPENITKDDRAFAIALGETYGARMFIAHRIERDLRRDSTSGAAGLEKLEAIRVPMRELVPQLRAAEAKGDTKTFADLRKRLLVQWNTLAAQYKELAATQAIRDRFDHELATNLDRPHKHM